MREISKALQDRRDEIDPTVVVLCGMPGSGKTQLALKYCRRTKASQRHDSIFWVDASSPSSTARSFSAIEESIFNTKTDPPNVDASVKKVTTEMSKWQTSWLIVFDNFDTPSLFDEEGKNIRDYFPCGNRGAILFTSTNEDAERLGHMIEVGKMTEDEGMELLIGTSGKESIGDEDKTTVQKIIARLGYLALAIDQAGAYIRVRNLTPGLFIDHFNNRREAILKERPVLWEYTRKLSSAKTAIAVSVFTTWEMSFQQIKGEGSHKSNKEHLLTLSAFLDNRHIRQALFHSYFNRRSPEWMNIFTVNGVWAKDEFWKVLKEFKDLSLLENLQDSEYGLHFGIHPLIHDWMKLRLNPEECQNYSLETIELLHSYANDSNVEMTLHSKRALVAHLNASVENNTLYKTMGLENPEKKDAAFIFADFYRSQGLYAQAEKFCGLAVAAWKAQVGPEHPDTLRMMGSLAMIYQSRGNFSQAETLYVSILDGFKAQLGDDQTDIIKTMHNLSLLYRNQKRYVEAENLGKQVLELKIQTLGPKDLSTLRSKFGLATTYQLQGRYEEAEPLYIRTLNDVKIGDGSRGWAFALDIFDELASVYRLQRRYGEAEHLFKQVLKLRETVSGPEHPATFAALSGLAIIFKDQNRNAEAKELLQQVLQQENVLGIDDPNMIWTRNQLESLKSQGG